MSSGKYNGWSNYETWVVALWLDNEEGSYNYWNEVAEGLDVYDLSKRLEEEFEEFNPVEATGVYSDLLTHALGRVDWYEIAEHLKEE
jgi:hypothetical protein